MKKLYNIKCSQYLALTKIRDMFDKHGIENYIFDGGIHIHIIPAQFRIARDIAKTYNSHLEIGMLPAAQKTFNTLMKKVVRKYQENQEK